jgi:hypothetical protein
MKKLTLGPPIYKSLAVVVVIVYYKLGGSISFSTASQYRPAVSHTGAVTGAGGWIATMCNWSALPQEKFPCLKKEHGPTACSL